MKKRLLACLMSVSMVFTLMYGSAVAAEGGGQEKIEEAQEKQEVSTPSDADQIVATGSNGKPAVNFAAARRRYRRMRRTVGRFMRLERRMNLLRH